MKYAIKDLNKEQYKNVYYHYKETKKGMEQINRLFRLTLVGIISIIFSIISIINLVINYTSWVKLLLPIGLLIFGIVFLVSSYKLKIISLNNYYIKNKNSRY